jgi:acyl-CoA reductase-like NAD-dependent aldehyde dehydrogenase
MAVAEDLDVAKFLRDQPKRLFIGGRWVEAEGGRLFGVEDPATGEQLASVAEAQAADVDRAVVAARSSFDRATFRPRRGRRCCGRSAT